MQVTGQGNLERHKEGVMIAGGSFVLSKQPRRKLPKSGSCLAGKAPQLSCSGFTLLEIVIALAIFAVTLGATAQGLAYAYGLVTLQNQRVVAVNDCRAVISGLRQVLAEDPDTSSCPDTANKYPCLLLDWRNRFPATAAAVAALPATARVPFAGLYTLRNETITIALNSSTGGSVVNGTGPSTSTNPVYVKVRVQWTGPRGITYTETVSTVITNV